MNENKNKSLEKDMSSQAAELSEEQLENASGGLVFYAKFGAGNPNKPWEVIDDVTGEVRGRYKDEKSAINAARKKKQSTGEATWSTVSALRRGWRR